MSSAYQFWPAPAKLNLFLQITGRREDGYHNLQTVFQFLDVGDRLRFVIRDDKKVMRKTDLEGVKPEDDLVIKAARALQLATGTEQGADIYVQKILPMGGGLGGGSSDAATTLVVLNYLWQCGLDEDALAEIGLSLGADVPVFVRGYAAFAQGVGEQLEAVEPKEMSYLIVNPEVHISTAEIFTNSQLTRDSSAIRICDLQIGTANEANVLDELGNVFESVTMEAYPVIKRIKDFMINNGAIGSLMSGSGPSVYGICEDKQKASHLAYQLKVNNIAKFIYTTTLFNR